MTRLGSFPISIVGLHPLLRMLRDPLPCDHASDNSVSPAERCRACVMNDPEEPAIDSPEVEIDGQPVGWSRRNGRRRMDSNRPHPTRRVSPDFHGPGKGPSLQVEPWSAIEPLIRRWRSLVIGGAALALTGWLAGGYIWPTSYTCTAQLIRYEPPVATDAFKPRPLVTPTLVGMMLSPELLQKVGARAHPPLSAEQLTRRLKVTPERNSEITSVAVSGRDLQAVLELANDFCAETVQRTREIQIQEAAEANNYATQQLAQIDTDIAALRESLRSSYFASVETLEPTDPAPSSDKPAASETPRPSGKLTEEIQAARQELVSLLGRFTPESTLVQAQRARIRALVEQLQGDAIPGEATRTNVAAPPSSATARQKIAPPKSSADYDLLHDQLRVLEASRSGLIGRQRAIEVFRASPPGYYRVFLPAKAEDARVHHNRLKLGFFAVFCGMAGMAGTAVSLLFFEFMDDRMKSVADVKRVTRLPLLAALGDLRRMTSAQRDNWAFRAWTALQSRLSLSPNHGLVCGVTSSGREEGRSTWIHLLAQAALQRGFRVLTIATRSSSLRNGNGPAAEDPGSPPDGAAAESAALTMNFLSAPGQVAEKLLGANRQPIVHIPLPGWVWNLERRKQWQEALDDWRKIDNIVILVELPPSSVAESVLLAENLPNLIWLVESGKSDATETRMQLETLRHARCNLVGAVLNREPSPPIKKRFTRWLAAWPIFIATSLIVGTECQARVLPENHRTRLTHGWGTWVGGAAGSIE
jgi:hypothetical protein